MPCSTGKIREGMKRKLLKFYNPDHKYLAKAEIRPKRKALTESQNWRKTEFGQRAWVLGCSERQDLSNSKEDPSF